MYLGLAQTLNPLDAFSPSNEKHAARPSAVFARLPSGEILIATRIGPPGLAKPEFRAANTRELPSWTPPNGYVEVDPGTLAALLISPPWWRTWEGVGLIGAGAFMTALVFPLLFD